MAGPVGLALRTSRPSPIPRACFPRRESTGDRSFDPQLDSGGVGQLGRDIHRDIDSLARCERLQMVGSAELRDIYGGPAGDRL